MKNSSNLGKRLFFEYIRCHLRRVCFAAMCMIVAASATAGNALIMKPVIDEIFVEKNTDLLMFIPLAIFLIAVVKGAASYGQSVIMKYIGQRVTTDMQLTLYQHLLKSDISLFGEESSGKLISRFSNDINIIRKNLTNVLTGLAKESVTLLLLLGVMFYQSVELALIGFLVFPTAIYPILKLGRKMRKVSGKTQEELGDFTSKLDDTFQGIRMVKAYGNEQYEVERSKTVVERIFALYIKAAKIESLSSPIMESLAGIAIAAIIWYGGNQVLDGTTTPGAFFSFIAALIMAYKPMKSLSGINTNMQEGLAAVKRFYAVIDEDPLIKDKENAISLSGDNFDIKFENVSFSYKMIPSPPLGERVRVRGAITLNNISFTVPSGKRIALVGKSGGGKSTIMNMILRFYDPDKGKIFVGGEDIRNITIESLRSHIAVVNQEATLFDDTIRANILYGKMNATEEEMINASTIAAAHDFIVEQSEGYDTVIGQNGTRLSGGQRQRIAIARAMLRNAPILLLDEATSALDTVSEQKVQKALDKLMIGRTTVVVAHRLSTIISADLIYVVDNGEIIESGTHNELLEKNGKYSELYEEMK